MDSHWINEKKDVVSKVLKYSKHTRLFVWTFWVLVSSGFFAYFTEYATYAYSITYGFRPPVEGVPYLKATVASLAFAAALAMSLIFLMVIYSAKALRAYMKLSEVLGRFLPDRDTDYKVQKILNWIETKIREPKDGTLYRWAVITPITLYFFLFLRTDDLKCNIVTCFFHPVVLLLFFPSAYLLLLVRPKSDKHIAVFYALLALLIVLRYAATPSNYATFLRFAGFGGGKPVSVYMLDADSKSETRIDGGLLIRSNDYLTVYSERTQSSLEIPMRLVRKIEYGNSSKNAILPKLNK
ncbi:hypothetical protein BZG78_15140 [Salinivibrio sp. MA351]|uniref:hypothetical protein n=1 Tax=Salinivibrio sp. MA351 TaxID=1909453 RepID=UPI0009899286|nr:hypothetical protein [Salinivibrio sp. MA351]OOE95195.1 hypothetical protein BZG78_15140 [Salinivibrio sp. MA351]